MNNEHEIIEGKFEELEKVEEKINEEVGSGYRYKNTKKSKKKGKKPYKTILVATIVGFTGFYVGQLYSRYEININVTERGVEQISINDKLSTDEANKPESTELVFNSKDSEILENKGNAKSDSRNSISEAINSVVSISAKSVGGSRFYSVGESAGSGVIVGEDNEYVYMITNNHVVNRVTTFQVSLDDEVYVEAKVLGTDPENDLAIIYSKKESFIDAGIDYYVADVGNSDDLQLGDKVYAIGNSAGEGKSVTSGIVGALNKSVTFNDGTSMEFIQTDAAINPGNSGGALVDEDGYLVGINTAKLVNSSIEGMGYSIPINVAIEIGQDLVKKPFMGIQGNSVEDIIEDFEALGLPKGVFVDAVVVNSASDKAGITSGDIITKIDDTEINNFNDLSGVLEGHSIGDVIEVTVFRRGDFIKLNLVLGSRANY